MHYLFGERFDLDPSFVMKSYSATNILSVLTVSSSDYCYALDLLPVPPDRIHRIVNAIEDDVFSYNFSSSRTIAYMPRKIRLTRVLSLIFKNQPWFSDSGWRFLPY